MPTWAIGIWASGRGYHVLPAFQATRDSRRTLLLPSSDFSMLLADPERSMSLI